MVHSGMWANTTIGVLDDRPFKSAVNPGELLGAQSPEAARLELQHIDERDEMHAGVIEAVVALVAGGFAEAVEVFGDGRIGRVVLAGDGMHLAGAQAREQLLRQIEFRGLRQMRDIARMDDERRLLGHAVHEIDGLGQSRIDVGIRVFVEADVGVADLNE